MMDRELFSLTDVLKKTLFFSETLTVAELIPHVQRKMLQDYSPIETEEKILLCLRQHPCFYLDQNKSWRLNLEGKQENDSFYGLLLKNQQPLSLKEVIWGSNAKQRNKKFRRIIANEASLISDGRFIQLDNGHWGLTEWEVETASYTLKELVIKALKLHPAGLSSQQVFEIVRVWRQTSFKDTEEILRKFPYFEKLVDGVWAYNPVLRVVYDNLMKRFIGVLEKQKTNWLHQRQCWLEKNMALKGRLQELTSAHKEIAAALALRAEEIGHHEQMVTQMAEKDLLLSLRKKEIFRYREHIGKLESKANSILYQCRLWVKRAREKEADNFQLRETIKRNVASMESLFAKLHQYKERDKENKALLAELKERHSIKIAQLQTEIIELRQKLERSHEMNEREKLRLRDDSNFLSDSLKEALKREEELEHSFRIIQQDLTNLREKYRQLERELRNPLVKLIVKLCSFLNWGLKRVF